MGSNGLQWAVFHDHHNPLKSPEITQSPPCGCRGCLAWAIFSHEKHTPRNHFKSWSWRVQWGEMGTNKLCDCRCNLLVIFMGNIVKYVWIIGLKAPGDYSDQLWLNQISILLCEEPKPPNSMNYVFGTCRNPYLLILLYQITSTNTRKTWTSFKRIIFVNIWIRTF